MAKIAVFFLLLTGILAAQTVRTDHWQKRNMLFNQELQDTKINQTVFLGNSLTEAFNFDYYFPDTPIINRGIVGDHIDGVLDRLQNSVFALQPSRLFILIGINDIGRGDPDSLILERYVSLLDSISILRENTEIYLTSILPTTARWANCPKEKIIRLNLKIKEFSEKYKLNWVNLYPLYISGEGYLKPELTTDGLHLNQAGYDIWVKQLKTLGLR